MEFLNEQHNLNKSPDNSDKQMNKMLFHNDLSNFLTSSDIDVHLLSHREMTNAEFMQLSVRMADEINKYIIDNIYDYFNSVLKAHGVRIVKNGQKIINVVKPTVKRLALFKFTRMYMEFEFIDSSGNKIDQPLEISDHSTDTNFRILPDSKGRLYIFDMVFERTIHNSEGINDYLTPHFSLNDTIQLPGCKKIHTLGMYDTLYQLYNLIKKRANKLARNIIRFALIFIFSRNHYLSPNGVKMCLDDIEKLRHFFIQIITNRNLNKIMNLSKIRINIKNMQDYNFEDTITKYTLRSYNCSACSKKHYNEMIYAKYNDAFQCCPSNNNIIIRSNPINIEHIDVYDYYDFSSTNNSLKKRIRNRKSPMLIDGIDNYNEIKTKFNSANVIVYTGGYNYNVGSDNSNIVITNTRLPPEIAHMYSKKAIIAYIPTFLFLENSIINENMYQSYNQTNYNEIRNNSSSKHIIDKLNKTFSKTNIEPILTTSDNSILDYIGNGSKGYNNKCRDLFINDSNNYYNRNVKTITDVEILQKYLIAGSRYNRPNYKTEYKAIHNHHNSFMTFSGQYLPITRVGNKLNETHTIDDISIGSEIIFNTFQSTSCYLPLSYNWSNNLTDVCYIIRTNLDNPQNQNAIFSIINSHFESEMEILYGFGNRFTIIDKFLTHKVNSHILNNLDLSPTNNLLFKQAKNILNNINKEKKMPVIDTNGSYLNDPVSKTYSSQIVAFQSFLNNNELGNGIGVSKSMPNIFYDGYEETDKTLSNSTTTNNYVDKLDKKLQSLYKILIGGLSYDGQATDTITKILINDPNFGQDYVNNQLKISRFDQNLYKKQNVVNTDHANIMIKNYLNSAINENIITLILSEATRKRILYSFPQLLDFYYTKNIQCSTQKTLPPSPNGSQVDIINSVMLFKHYGKLTINYDNGQFNPVFDFVPLDINMPNVDNDYHTLFADDFNLALYGLQYSIHNAYTIFGFAHGDIPNGREYNLMCDVEYVGDKNDPSKEIKYVMFETLFNNKIYVYTHKLSKPNYIPKIILMDFGFSNISYAGNQIQNKIAGDNTFPLPSTEQKLNHDLFGSKDGKEINGFCLNKLFKFKDTNSYYKSPLKGSFRGIVDAYLVKEYTTQIYFNVVGYNNTRLDEKEVLMYRNYYTNTNTNTNTNTKQIYNTPNPSNPSNPPIISPEFDSMIKSMFDKRI